ncbi:hypothetical protein GGX14DRAFT_319821, partial [Mycena pura]
PSARKCSGFPFPHSGHGKNASEEYPYAEHASRSLPWTYCSNPDGSLTLRAVMCRNECDAGQTCCKPCHALSKLELLQSMVERARDGVNENSNYAFYSFPRLINVRRKKDHRISYLRLGKLNAAKRIATQSRALADHKRFLRAVGTGKVER